LRRPLDSALATSNAARQSCCREKESNARLSLAKVIGRLESGDVLVVTRLDRLARSNRDLLNVIDTVSKRGAGFRSLKDAWADTTSAHGRLMLTVLGALAEFERELIRARTGEGERRSVASGSADRGS
jgi:DNA invertase Pin-like site-specific DNA recombinase